jgi:micrococcal nuclease
VKSETVNTLIAVTLILCISGCESRKEVCEKVRLDNGKTAVLFSDGTWEETSHTEIVRPDTGDVMKNMISAMVIEVLDGDTYIVEILNPDSGLQRIETVRLLGVDTPELAKGEYYSAEAKDYVERKILGKKIGLVLTDIYRDAFCRLLTYVRLDNGDYLNEDLITNGFARIFQGKQHEKYDRYMEIQEGAMEDAVGLWKSPEQGVKIVYIYNFQRCEYIAIQNTSSKEVHMSNWAIGDKTEILFQFPESVVLSAGGIVKVYSGSGCFESTDDIMTIGSKPIWNNDGDTAYMYDDSMELIDTYSY